MEDIKPMKTDEELYRECIQDTALLFQLYNNVGIIIRLESEYQKFTYKLKLENMEDNLFDSIPDYQVKLYEVNGDNINGDNIKSKFNDYQSDLSKDIYNKKNKEDTIEFKDIQSLAFFLFSNLLRKNIKRTKEELVHNPYFRSHFRQYFNENDEFMCEYGSYAGGYFIGIGKEKIKYIASMEDIKNFDGVTKTLYKVAIDNYKSNSSLFSLGFPEPKKPNINSINNTKKCLIM